MARLPSGTVTFLFTDIEGSTRLVQRNPVGYGEALSDHRRLLRAAFAAAGGRELGTEGDSFFVVFERARDAVVAAAQAQRAIASHPWAAGLEIKVRMGIHTSEPTAGPDPYTGVGVHRAKRICSAAHGGQVLLSKAARALVEDAPEGVRVRGLGRYRLKDLDHPDELFDLVIAGLPGDFPPPATVETLDRRARLPLPPSLTLGRDRDLDAIAERLRADAVRLLTLTGPGGVGKTRLAIEVARRLADEYADGAYFVDLSVIANGREIAAAITRGLGAPIREGEPVGEALVRFLAARRLLLVVDNLEHVLTGTALLGELLAHCPTLTILATSREPTRLAAEQVHAVDGLEVPPVSAPAPVLEGYGSVALFRARASARDPGFVLDAGSAPHVGEICRRLDGLPLALELAAARVGLLSPAELAARLDGALALLVGGARDAPERQRTLRATIDWSVRLLTEPERSALWYLAVFAAGATIDAVERVTGASLDTLDALVAKHLVARRGDRLAMLDTVRDYALEQLAADPARDAVLARLVEWSLAFVQEASPHVVRADRERWMPRLDAELPNVYVALDWALGHHRTERAFELVRGLALYWWQTHHAEDGLHWIDLALEQSDDADPGLTGWVLLTRARLVGWRLPERHGDDLRAALRLFRACDDAAGIAVCLAHWADLESLRGHFRQAAALADEASAAARRTDDPDVVSLVLGLTAMSADYMQTVQRARSALVAIRRAGDLLREATLCNSCGYQALANGRYDDADAWLGAGLRAGEQLLALGLLFTIRTNLALVRLFVGDFDAAAEGFSAALELSRQAGTENLIDETLLGLAAVEAVRCDPGRAARLAGAAALRQVTRSVDEERVWTRLYDNYLDPARERHGPQRWDEDARADGPLTAHEAIDLALRRGRFAPRATSTATAAVSAIEPA